MRVSVSLVVDSTEEYRVGFETVETGFLQDEVFEYLNKEGIEIVEVLLERIKGSKKTSIAVLSEISEVIYSLFETNENVILYFFCDDLNEIPCTHKEIAPQAYRSGLFSAMFERFIRKRNVCDVDNVAVCIEALGRPEYLHFIVVSVHFSPRRFK